MADEAYVLSLYREYYSNPNCEPKSLDQWKAENAALILATTSRKKSTGGGGGKAPILGVYEGSPGMPPASYGIPTSNKAPASAPAPAAMVTTECPYCHHNNEKKEDEDGTLQTEGPFSKIKSLVSSASGGKSLSGQLIEMVKSLLAFKDREPAKMESDRQAYFADIRRALETELMRKKRLSQQQAGELIGVWGDRWAYLWGAYVVRSRDSYKAVRMEAKIGGGKKEFSANDIAAAIASIVDATIKNTGSINELELANAMLSNMVEIARRTGDDGIDLLEGVFGKPADPQTIHTDKKMPHTLPYEAERGRGEKYGHLGRMFGTSLRAHLGNEKARMAATAFKRGAERAMLASAADMGSIDDAEASDERPSENSELADFVETRASLLGLAADESYIMLMPDASVEPGLKARIEAMTADAASRFVQAHAAPLSSLSSDGSGISRIRTLDGKKYVLVQIDSEPAMLYEANPATGARIEETGAAQVGSAIQKNGGRLFFIFFRRSFVKPDQMTATAGKNNGGGHEQVHRNLSSVSHLSTFAKLAHDTGLDKQLSVGGPYTVFAPKNSAFTKELLGKLPKDRSGQLRILQNHVVADSLTRSSELDGRRQTLGGKEVTIDAARGTINGARYKLEKRSPGLVVYEIDNVLL